MTDISLVKKLIYIDVDGIQAQTRVGDITNIGGTISNLFTVGGKGLLFSDGTTTDGSVGVSIASPSFQQIYTNSIANNGSAKIILQPGKDFTISNSTSDLFNLNSNGDLTLSGLINGINISTINDLLSTHLDNSVSPSKHSASQISVTPISLAPNATNVQETLDALNAIAGGDIPVPEGVSYGFEHLQLIPTSTWTITHNKNTKRIQWSLYNDLDEWILPNGFKIIDENTVEFSLGINMMGKAILILF